jgi:predicted lipoprotein with Yx(FWY)xxD motif
VGKWTVVDRKDGKKQWAYDNYALYTSVLDKRAGDVYGGTRKEMTSEEGAVRQPAGPTPNMPAQFKVRTMAMGRLVATADTGRSLYVWDKDTATKSNCDERCLHEWSPVLAPESVQPQGDWTIIQNSPGTKQWVFRGKPVYTHLLDDKTYSVQGGDIPGWHNVYTQLAPPAPKGFKISDNRTGQVLGDEQGRTLYVYNCNDDAVDQLSCHHPDAPQAYRLAICGRGDASLCLKNFPYAIAPKDAQPVSNSWSAVDIDPMTGKYATAGQQGALHVWAYRGRPVYLCGRDKKPGEIECDTNGEFNGARNGYKAFWIRDDFGRQSG